MVDARHVFRRFFDDAGIAIIGCRAFAAGASPRFAQQSVPPFLLRPLFATDACRLALHQHGLDRFIAQMAELHLTVQIIAHVFDDHEEAHDEQNPDDPRGQYHHFLSVGEREHRRQSYRNYESDHQSSALEFRVQFREPTCAFLDHLAVAAFVGQHLNGLGHVVSAFRKLHFLADNHVAFLDFAGEQSVEVDQQRTDRQTDDERHGGKQQQRADRLGPMAVVEAGNGLAECVYRIAEWHERIDHAEEFRHHLDRIQAGSAWNLHDHQRHAQALADVHERGGQRVRDAQIYQRCDHAGQYEQWRASRLHAEYQIANGADRALNDAHRAEQQVSGQILFGCGRIETLKPLVVHLHFVDHHKGERAHPQCQIGHQRSHAGAVGVDGIHVLRVDYGRGLHERGDLIRVKRTAAGQRCEQIRSAQRLQVGADGGELRLHLRQLLVGLLKADAGV